MLAVEISSIATDSIKFIVEYRQLRLSLKSIASLLNCSITDPLMNCSATTKEIQLDKICCYMQKSLVTAHSQDLHSQMRMAPHLLTKLFGTPTRTPAQPDTFAQAYISPYFTSAQTSPYFTCLAGDATAGVWSAPTYTCNRIP